MVKLAEVTIFNHVEYVLLMVRVNASPQSASKASRGYWAKCDKTHRDTSWNKFQLYYRNIKEIMNPTKNDSILDAGCGGGELTWLLHRDGFNVKGFDSSEFLIRKAKKRFGNDLFFVDDLINLKTEEKFSKVFLNNAFFYIHPSYYKVILKNLCRVTEDKGTVYLFDDPDYSKRNMWDKRYLVNILTFFLPVYNARTSGFWVKTSSIRKKALNAGFSNVEKLDSWAYYRSHHIISKEAKK
jgi:SAM-dependent methyltransferase